MLTARLAFLFLAEKTDSPSVPNNNKIALQKEALRFLGEFVFFQGKKYPLGRFTSLQKLVSELLCKTWGEKEKEKQKNLCVQYFTL